ncbi:M23 family metallopeptidase [Erythrobacter aureus]|nr:M23 family metallopeptidase [Erythrobacter aureus]
MKNFSRSKIALAVATLILPVATHAQMTSGFGMRADPFHGRAKKHSGVDLAKPTGTPIYATANGHVGRAGMVGSYGNLVEINHGNGYQTRYAHMHRIFVRSGQYVQRGTKIGEVGSTGRSTGPHLHYEVRYEGKALDPKPYIRGQR